MSGTARFSDVIAWYSSHAPGSLAGLREPVPSAELAALRLPTEVAELFSMCDGQHRTSAGILPQYQLLSLADAREFRDMMIGITSPPVLDEEPLYNGFTRSEVEASGQLADDSVQVGDDASNDVPRIPVDLSPDERREREERELHRAGEMLEYFHGSPEEYRRLLASELDGYRFTLDHLPIAEWDSGCIAVEVSTGTVFEWEVVDGRSHSWPSLAAMYAELLAALEGGPPFLSEMPVVVDGVVEWEFDESVLESELPAPSYAQPDANADTVVWNDVTEFVIDLTTLKGVADYLGGEDRGPASVPFAAQESADFTTTQHGRVTLLEFADIEQADSFRTFAARESLHFATLDDEFAVVADTAARAADLQSSLTFE